MYGKGSHIFQRIVMLENIKTKAIVKKDSLVAAAIRGIVNRILSQSSQRHDVKLESLRIDSIKKNITATIALPELSQPLTIEAADYSIVSEGDRHFLVVKELLKSQEWTNAYLDKKRYKIPPEIVKASAVLL